MVRTLATLAAGALLMAGCATHDHGARHAQQLERLLHSRPLVTVRYGVISIAPEPIVIHLKEVKGPLVFQLPEGYRFPAKAPGIEFLGVIIGENGQPQKPSQDLVKEPRPRLNVEARRHFLCTTDDKTYREVSCQVTSSVLRNAVYRYTIRVEGPNGTITWDPNVFSMD